MNDPHAHPTYPVIKQSIRALLHTMATPWAAQQRILNRLDGVAREIAVPPQVMATPDPLATAATAIWRAVIASERARVVGRTANDDLTLRLITMGEQIDRLLAA